MTDARNLGALFAALSCAMALHAPVSDAADRDQPAAAQNPYSARLLAAINAYRVKHGEAELNASANLDSLADDHSKTMARAGRLSHEGFRERGMRADSPLCVENVGWNYVTPEAQLRAWIESPGHERNMLDTRVTQAGVGKANAYVTFIACR